MGHIKKGIVIAAIMLAAVLIFVFWTERQGDEAKFSDFLYSRLKITDEHVKRITLRRYIDDYSFISADDPLEQAAGCLIISTGAKSDTKRPQPKIHGHLMR